VLAAGSHRYQVPLAADGRALPSGVYFLSLEAGGAREVRTVVVTR
jgi:hypothetical protein